MRILKSLLLIFGLLISGCIALVPNETDVNTDIQIPETTLIIPTEIAEDPPVNTQSPELLPLPEETPVSTVQEPEPTSILVPTEELPADLIATPERSRHVGVDMHHGSVSRIVKEYISGKGWIVEDIDVEPLTQDYLEEKGISILYIANCSLAYTEDEIIEINNFVNAGGGLIIESRFPEYDYGMYQSEIARSFGVRFSEVGDGTPDSLTITIKSDHFLFKDVTSLFIKWSQPYLTVVPPAYTILSAGNTEPYKPIVAAVEVGDGRVVIFPTLSGEITRADNQYFIRNIIYWLQKVDLP